MIVIVEFAIRVVDNKVVEGLLAATSQAKDDRVESPLLPGVSVQNIKGVSLGFRPMDIAYLQDQVAIATGGEPPTAVLFVRQVK